MLKSGAKEEDETPEQMRWEEELDDKLRERRWEVEGHAEEVGVWSSQLATALPMTPKPPPADHHLSQFARRRRVLREITALYDQKRQEAVIWGLRALGLEEEEVELRKQLVLLVDQEHSQPCEELWAFHFQKYPEAANMRWVASGLEEELYQLRDQVVYVGDGVGADVEELRGQMLALEEERRKDLEEELEYSETHLALPSPGPELGALASPAL